MNYVTYCDRRIELAMRFGNACGVRYWTEQRELRVAWEEGRAK